MASADNSEGASGEVAAEGAEVRVLRHEAGWAEVQLNRPQRKNAITGPLGTRLAAALEALRADASVRVIVLAGADGAFCSGLDVKAFNAEPPPEWRGEFAVTWRGVHRALYECDKPLIGALERYAINGGAALALACDLLVVGRGAFLQVGEVAQGLAAPYNLAWLNRRFAPAVAAQLTLVGERWEGPELARLGIAYRVVDDDLVLKSAQDLARQLAGYPEGALTRIKSGLRAHWREGADAWFDQFVAVDPVAAAPTPKVNPSL